MIFSSAIFLFAFLPLTLTFYFLLIPKFRNYFLLASSLLFYAWGEPIYILIMLFSILINYMSGIFIQYRRDNPCKGVSARILLAICIGLNLSLLIYFKYTNFLVDVFNKTFGARFDLTLNNPGIILPIGISFFTFQAMSYVIDIYRQEVKPQRNLLNCGLYIALFPQLIAGPIVRYRDIAKQISSRTISSESFASGIRRFIFGLAKKVLIANVLGEVVDGIFNTPIGKISTGTAWIGISYYTLQIYFDFSGYSDMAIGLGKMFGFDFMENFNYPYIAKSVQEFWRRWHISLSTWFRDYLYIPLGGNRVSPLRLYINLWVVFLLCGLWHGASWNFVIWGALHGAVLVFERLGWRRVLSRLWFPLPQVYTVLFVMIAWVFFRAENLSLATEYLGRMFSLTAATAQVHYLPDQGLKTTLTFYIGCILSTPIFPYIRDKIRFLSADQRVLQPVLAGCNLLLIFGLFFLSATSLAAGTYNPFIYFRF